MNDLLYLDTARIGQMSLGAKETCHAVSELACQSPDLLFELVTTESSDEVIPHWKGRSNFEGSMRECFEATEDSTFFTAGNSAALLKVAARAIFSSSRRVQCTDLVWPRYRDLLEAEARHFGKHLSVVPIRKKLESLDASAIVDYLGNEFSKSNCDALFLTSISSDGFTLPIGLIVEHIESQHDVRMVVVDGAQEFAHQTHLNSANACDLYLFGTHKWLGSYYPLSVGKFGWRRSREFLQTTARRLVETGQIEDPIFRHCTLNGSMSDTWETTNLLPLFTGAGALSDFVPAPSAPVAKPTQGDILNPLRNLGWQPVNLQPDARLSNRILMLRNERYRSLPGNRLRRLIKQVAGINCSAYEDGIIRLSFTNPDDMTIATDRLARLNS